jgi:hypothetical protein
MSGAVRRWTIRLVTAGLVAYLVALATLFALQRQLLFPAGKEPPSLERAGLAGLMEPVKIVDRAHRRAAVRRSRRARRNHPREVRTSVVRGRSGAEGGHVAAGCPT